MKTHSDERFRSKKYDRRKLVQNMRTYLSEWLRIYCENTSLHGFHYITMNGSKIVECFFWFMLCIAAVIFCIILMLRLWANYSSNPIVTTIYTSNPIWDVFFPAVTICNNNKVYRPHADVIAEYLHAKGFSRNESDRFFSSLIKLIRPDKISIGNVTAREVLDYLDMPVETLMQQLMQPCNALLVRCAWLGHIYDCSKIFKTVKSKEGFCCAFNSHYYLNIDHKFNDNFADFNVTEAEDLPGVLELLKAPGSGRDVGLSVALNVERDKYKATSRPFIGASIMIHDPIDFPDVGTQFASVTPGHVLSISVSCTSIRSMDSLRNLPLEKRLCYFGNEVPGETRYSYQSCISQCVAKYVLRFCNCLPFYYPHIHRETKTCYLPDQQCLLNLRKSLAISGRTVTCRECFPQCTDILYHTNVESVKMDDAGFDSDITRGFDLRNISFVYVFFGDLSYVEYRKESTISWDSLIASFGGIFGLCLGGSVISVIELIYLLVRQLFKRQFCKTRGQSLAPPMLPPASKIFIPLSISGGKVPQQKLRNHQECSDKGACAVNQSFIVREKNRYCPIFSRAHQKL